MATSFVIQLFIRALPRAPYLNRASGKDKPRRSGHREPQRVLKAASCRVPPEPGLLHSTFGKAYEATPSEQARPPGKPLVQRLHRGQPARWVISWTAVTAGEQITER